MAMLRPAPKSAEWTTSQAGIFAKYADLSDFGLSGIGEDGAGWILHQADAGGPFFKHVGVNSNGVGGIGPVQPANQPIVLEFYVPNVTNAPFGIMECGWGDPEASGVSLRFYQDGHVEVWKDGIYLFTGSVSDLRLGQSKRNTFGVGRPSGYVTVMLIPCCDRSLLVETSSGGGFLYDFPDLPEGVGGLAITPNDTFWFNVPAPCDAVVRVAQLQYAQTPGSINGPVTGLRVAVPAGASWSFTPYQACSQATLTPVGGGSPGLVSVSVVAPNTNPLAISNPIQLQATLSPSSEGASYTPFLYAVRAFVPAQVGQSATPEDGPLDVTAYCTHFSLEVTDYPGNAWAAATLSNPAALAGLGVSNLTSLCGRAVSLSDGEGTFLAGICEAPETDVRWGVTDEDSDSVTEVRLMVRDVWKLAEEYVFLDPIPLDGLSLGVAYGLLAETMGLTARFSPSAETICLPIAGVCARGEWNCLVLPGDKGAEWLRRLHETYAGTWMHGVNREGVLCLFDPADAVNVPSVAGRTLYPSLKSAITASVAAAAAPANLYRSLKVRVLEPEANDLALIGIDPRSQRPILVGARDASSADPTTPLDSRPPNWLGRLKRVAFGDPGLATPAACMAAASQLFNRLSVSRTIVEFECEFLDGLWYGDLVTLRDVPGGFGDLTVRLKAMSARFRQVATDGTFAVWRPTRYVGEVGELVCPLGISGAGADQIAANWKFKAVSKRTARRTAMEASRRAPIDVQVV
jgi:hypothetical protein